MGRLGVESYALSKISASYDAWRFLNIEKTIRKQINFLVWEINFSFLLWNVEEQDNFRIQNRLPCDIVV